MKRIVFGLGLLQVAVTMAVVAGIFAAAGLLVGTWGWRWEVRSRHVVHGRVDQAPGRAPAGRFAHGREIMGVLLFQDLAVVPLLVLIPALSQPRRCSPC